MFNFKNPWNVLVWAFILIFSILTVYFIFDSQEINLLALLFASLVIELVLLVFIAMAFGDN